MDKSLNLDELIKVVEELKCHWVGKYLTKVFISCYRGKKTSIDLRLFNQLDCNNQGLFIGILNMRSDRNWNDETLYQVELKLKKIVRLK